MLCLKSKVVKIKKTRECWGCNKKSYPGHKMTYNVCVDSGKINDSYWCSFCTDYIESLRKRGMIDYDDGIANGEFVGSAAYKIFVKEKVVFTRKLLIEKVKPNFTLYNNVQFARINIGRIFA